jgi:hypothetical protein
LLKKEEEEEKEAGEKKLAELKEVKEKAVEDLEDQKDDSIKWKNSYLYDIINNVMSPELPEIQTLDGAYRRIEFKLKPSRSTTENLDMINKAAAITGTVILAAKTVPFTFAMEQAMEFKLKGAGALKVDGGQSNNLIIAFDVVSWFAGIDFSSATLNLRGEVEIDEKSNVAIYTSIVKKMKLSTRFGEDEDGEGSLDADEADGDGQEAIEAEEAEEAEGSSAGSSSDSKSE